MPLEKLIEKVAPEHIEVVHACHQTCLMTLKHCLVKGDDHVNSYHLTLLLDCEGICHLHEDFLLRGSHHHHAICKACEAICDECAKSCEAFGADQTTLACAQACRRCRDVCRMM